MSSRSADRTPHRSRPPAPAAEHATSGPSQLGPSADLLALPADPAITQRGNSPVRIAAVLRLQRTLGNRATGRLLQRIASGPAPLPVQRDGTGLAGDVPSGAFTADAQGILANWANLTSVQRARQLVAVASVQLQNLGAPRITEVFSDTRMSGGSTYGAFSPGVWMITLNEAGFADTCTDEQKARAVGTVYHEMRHAEQYFRVARMLAGQGEDASGITKSLGLAGVATTVAVQTPLKDPSRMKFKSKEEQQQREQEYEEAKAWRGAMALYHGKGGISETLEQSLAEYFSARDQLRATPQDTNLQLLYTKAWHKARGAYKLYHQAAVEADAWRVGGAIETRLGQQANTAETELATMGNDPQYQYNYTRPTQTGGGTGGGNPTNNTNRGPRPVVGARNKERRGAMTLGELKLDAEDTATTEPATITNSPIRQPRPMTGARNKERRGAMNLGELKLDTEEATTGETATIANTPPVQQPRPMVGARNKERRGAMTFGELKLDAEEAADTEPAVITNRPALQQPRPMVGARNKERRGAMTFGELKLDSEEATGTEAATNTNGPPLAQILPQPSTASTNSPETLTGGTATGNQATEEKDQEQTNAQLMRAGAAIPPPHTTASPNAEPTLPTSPTPGPAPDSDAAVQRHAMPAELKTVAEENELKL